MQAQLFDKGAAKATRRSGDKGAHQNLTTLPPSEMPAEVPISSA